MTSQGELEHRRVKRFYARTSRKNYRGQIAQHIRREKILHDIVERETARRHRIAGDSTTAVGNAQSGATRRKRGRPRKEKPTLDLYEDDPLTATPFNAQHQISDSEREHSDITIWALKNAHDPAVKVIFRTLFNTQML